MAIGTLRPPQKLSVSEWADRERYRVQKLTVEGVFEAENGQYQLIGSVRSYFRFFIQENATRITSEELPRQIRAL